MLFYMPIMPLSFIRLDLLGAGGYLFVRDDSAAQISQLDSRLERVRLDNIKRPTHIAGILRY